MMKALAVDRLVKLCGMFGSEHDGERANAAAKADALVRSHGLVWGDVIALPKPAARSPTWREEVLFAAENLDLLTEWERGFIDSLTSRTHPPSDKQRAIIERIAEKLRAAGRE